MLNYYIMTNEGNKVPFDISYQIEIPCGFPDAGLHRHLQLTNQGARCPDCGFWIDQIHGYHPKHVVASSHNATPIVIIFSIGVLHVMFAIVRLWSACFG